MYSRLVTCIYKRGQKFITALKFATNLLKIINNALVCIKLIVVNFLVSDSNARCWQLAVVSQEHSSH